MLELLVARTTTTAAEVYRLRSKESNWDKERRWRNCAMLTDLKSGFCSLNSELRLILDFHSKQGLATFTGLSPCSPTHVCSRCACS